MKVLFLDIDGVVNNAKTDMSDGWGIDPYMAFLVGKIQLDTGCEFILSSAWRYSEEGKNVVRKKVGHLLFCTPLDGETRGQEIKDFLDAHPEVTHYAIVDDENDFHKDQLTHLFKTSFQTGLTKEIADEITNYLNK